MGLLSSILPVWRSETSGSISIRDSLALRFLIL